MIFHGALKTTFWDCSHCLKRGLHQRWNTSSLILSTCNIDTYTCLLNPYVPEQQYSTVSSIALWPIWIIYKNVFILTLKYTPTVSSHSTVTKKWSWHYYLHVLLAYHIFLRLLDAVYLLLRKKQNRMRRSFWPITRAR